MTYPGAITSFSTKTDNSDFVLAAHMNAVQADITAIETALGTNPQGSATDLKTRLAKSISDAGMLKFTASTTLTIASGIVTPTQNYHLLDTEAAAATDDLDTITAAGEAFILFVRTVSGARNVVIKHGTGNISCAGGKDITLDNNFDLCVLIYDANLVKWAAFRGPVGRFGDAVNYSDFSADGTLTMAGTARVQKVHNLGIDGLTAGAAAPTITRLGNYYGYGFNINDNGYTRAFEIPFDWDTSTDVTLRIHWYCNETYAAHSGEVRWNAAYTACQQNSEVVDIATTTLDYGDINIPATAKMLLESVATIPAADLAINDSIGINISRIALVGGSNPTAQPVIISLEIEYTANKLGV